MTLVGKLSPRSIGWYIDRNDKKNFVWAFTSDKTLHINVGVQRLPQLGPGVSLNSGRYAASKIFARSSDSLSRGKDDDVAMTIKFIAEKTRIWFFGSELGRVINEVEMPRVQLDNNT